MSEIWPFDVWNKENLSPRDSSKSFKCFLLMPFEKRFDEVAQTIRDLVEKLVRSFPSLLPPTEPIVERVDWVTSSEVIQQEIWERILGADLIFCDISGYNPNVMFECGVCAGWRKINEVVFIKDASFVEQVPFDIAPKRYIEYDRSWRGRKEFGEKVQRLVRQALIRYPDGQGESPEISLPLLINFKDNRDSDFIYTPPFAHRRMIANRLEFGSSLDFGSSWATIGKERFDHFYLEFKAKFSNVVKRQEAWIGVGLHSQHCAPGLAHIFYLRANGMIIIAEPNEKPPKFYEDNVLRNQKKIDMERDHTFRVSFDNKILKVEVDDFPHSFRVDKMPKILPPGLIRFQAFQCWMALSSLKLEQVHSK